MSLGVVVTGAGGGIGRAIAARMASEGHRVVVNDLNPEAAERVAEAIGGIPAPEDAASEQGVAQLHARAVDQLGDIDVWFANAGIDRGRGLDTSEQDWSDSLEVNLMAHVRAARLLMPRWLERGQGRFVVTASAAGLLIMNDAPTYSVSKNAAVAFADWLSATYRHRGITVQAICPQQVNTDMLIGSGPVLEVTTNAEVLEPEDVASCVMEAMEDDRFLILPHPQVADYAAMRATDRDRWLRGMNKLQQRLERHGS